MKYTRESYFGTLFLNNIVFRYKIFSNDIAYSAWIILKSYINTHINFDNFLGTKRFYEVTYQHNIGHNNSPVIKCLYNGIANIDLNDFAKIIQFSLKLHNVTYSKFLIG